jgi:hypothetical protein
MILPALLVKLVVGGATLITTLRYGGGIYFWREAEKLEKPIYIVLQKLSNNVEIRRYEPYLIAETIVDGNGFRASSPQGFRVCAGYIFGKNKSRSSSTKNGESTKMAMTAPVRVSGSSEKMAMTAPVRVQGSDKGNTSSRGSSILNYFNNSKGKTKVSFVIGKKYSKQTAPKPLDNNVKVREVPAHTLAVRTFSGPPPTDDRVEEERQIITNALLKDPNMMMKVSTKSIKTGETFVYGYHDPVVTPNFLRRNEVALLIEGSA